MNTNTMKHYSIKLNDEQFNLLHKAWSEADTILSGSTDYLSYIKKRGLAMSALKSKDRLLKRLWKLIWFTENYYSFSLEIELLCLEGNAENLKLFFNFDELMAKTDDRLHNLSVYLHDNNLNEEAWVWIQFDELQHVKALKVEDVQREVIF